MRPSAPRTATARSARSRFSCLIAADLNLWRAARDSNPNRQIRSLVLYVDLVGSRPIWPAQVGCLVGPDGSRRIVWMIIGMIKAHPTEIGWQGKQQPL